MTRTVLAYVISLGAGIIAGLVYWLMGVATPAPPWQALCGLLGILFGEACIRRLRERLPRRRGQGTPAPSDRTAGKD
ncbi:DUF1427 family protein [Nonomuraea typhae]|uniref:DUF1427 family protein n=1 Tax=Nonomuraea typhae TaxID=2603600 RepID=UPI0012FC6BC2